MKRSDAALPDQLTGALIGLARATENNAHMLTAATAQVTVEGLCATGPDDGALQTLLARVDEEKRKLIPNCYVCASPCGRNNNYDMGKLRDADPDVRNLKTQLLSRIRDIAANTSHTGNIPEDTANFLYLALYAIGMDDWGMEELLPITLKADRLLHP